MPQGGRSRRRSRRNVLCNCACHDMQIVIHPATRVCAELKDLHTDMCFADTTIGRPYSAICSTSYDRSSFRRFNFYERQSPRPMAVDSRSRWPFTVVLSARLIRSGAAVRAEPCQHAGRGAGQRHPTGWCMRSGLAIDEALRPAGAATPATGAAAATQPPRRSRRLSGTR